MTIREDVQNRIDFLEGEVARLAAQTECLHKKIEGNERDIERKQAELEGLRFAAGIDGNSLDAPKPREKVLVQPAALKLLAEEPMTAEALAARVWFGAHQQQVLSWVTRALRHGKIKKRDDDCLEVSG